MSDQRRCHPPPTAWRRALSVALPGLIFKVLGVACERIIPLGHPMAMGGIPLAHWLIAPGRQAWVKIPDSLAFIR